MRFVHTADWQLGMTRHFLAGEAQPQYSAARRDAVAGLGPLAAQVGAEFVVVAGDVFEDNQLAPKVISQSLEAMRAIGIPVYLLPGNHDPLDASSVYTSALFTAECPANVHVLDRPGVHEVRPGLQIVAAPWRSKRPTTDLVADVLEDLPADGVARVLVAHGGIEHGVEQLAVGPFMTEVMFDEFSAVVIHGIQQLRGLGFIAQAFEQAAVLPVTGGI